MLLKRITTKEGEIYFVNAKSGEQIKIKNADSFLYTFPSGVLALFTLLIATIIMFSIGSLLESYDKESIIAYIINAVIITVGCFIIIRKNPNGIWYVPFISNTALILAALAESNFWRGIMWIPICGGWILNIIASITAALIGNHNIKTKNI
jgi:hypothetical protein